MRATVLIFCVILLASCGNDEYLQEHNKKMADIAKTCKAQVIKTSLVPAYSRFDAYYDPANSQWSYFGTEDERFKFRKCLVENGVQLSAEK